MAFALFYNASDSQTIQDSYVAAAPNLVQNDRRNIDACWNAGINTWNTTAVRALNLGIWHPACFVNGTLDNGLCDEDTRIIVVNGLWGRTVAAYGAVNGQPIHKAGLVGLLHRMADADPDLARREYIHTIAEDISQTAREPYP